MRKLLASLLLRRAARRYAMRLPYELTKSYGASERYTAEQIRRAAQECELNPRYLALGYAAYLAASDFAAESGRLSINPGYEAARTLFERFRRRQWDSADSKNVAYGDSWPGPDSI